MAKILPFRPRTSTRPGDFSKPPLQKRKGSEIVDYIFSVLTPFILAPIVRNGEHLDGSESPDTQGIVLISVPCAPCGSDFDGFYLLGNIDAFLQAVMEAGSLSKEEAIEELFDFGFYVHKFDVDGLEHVLTCTVAETDTMDSDARNFADRAAFFLEILHDFSDHSGTAQLTHTEFIKKF